MSAALLSVILAGPAASTAQGASVPTRLLQADDLIYEGSFTVPTSSGGNETSLAYGGAGLAFNPANNSLFITGHDWHQLTAEIAIPTPAVNTNPANLPRADFIQTPVDATGGALADIATPPEDTFAKVGGYLVNGEQLIVSAYDFYDAGGDQIRSHLTATTALIPTGPMSSIATDVPARWLGGAMTHIPAAWQAEFGGDPWLTGLAGISIASNSSVGPAAATFSPASLTGADPAQLVLGYPLSSALDGPETQSELWNLTSTVKGMVFPEATASVLFVGSHGVGPYCYGTGQACGDPVDPHQGTHAYPYRTQVWAYDAADMAQVYVGQTAPESLRPYAVFELDLPYDHHEINGVAYDAETGRIFVAQALVDSTRPVIHVFTVADDVPSGDEFCDGKPVTIDMNTNGGDGTGTDKDDVILGTPGADVIDGGSGSDTICGQGGVDIINGGDGDDTIHGGFGIDYIYGEAGEDTLDGGGGSDRMFGGADDDLMLGDSGADRMYGGPGDDDMRGMGGQDFMWGEAGNDLMQGNFQTDNMWGGDGNDTMFGAGGKDSMFGEAGNDSLNGGMNTDYLDGGDGVDTANGGRGRDKPLVAPEVRASNGQLFDGSGCIAETIVNCQPT